MPKKTPCKECEERHPGCHGECEKFKAFREELDKIKEAKFKEKQKDLMLGEFQDDAFRRTIKRTGRRR